MTQHLTFLKGAAVAACLGSLAIGTFGALVTQDAIAQIRPAYVRDVDTPSLQPFRGGAQYTLAALNDQRLIATVPAGKRLVIEYISWNAFVAVGTQFVFAGIRSAQFGPFAAYIQITPPHASADSAFVLQDGSQPVKLYFEAGEEVWVSASKNSGGTAQFSIQIHGHFITPP